MMLRYLGTLLTHYCVHLHSDYVLLTQRPASPTFRSYNVHDLSLRRDDITFRQHRLLLRRYDISFCPVA